MNNIIAIDPASYSMGLAWFMDGRLVATKTIKSDKDTPLSRRLDMADKLAVFIETADKIVSEEPLLLGRNNNSMQRLLGYIELLTNGDATMIHPMTVKKFTGSGTSDKLEMALSVGEMLETDDEKEILADAISREAMDETDAVAIGLCYLKKGVTPNALS